MSRTMLLVGLLCASATLADAQQQGFPENCHGVFRATVASRVPRGDLEACAPYVVPEVADAVRRAKRRSATDIVTLAGYTAFFRDAAIFRAALDLAGDGGAPDYARAYGLALALSHVSPGALIGPSLSDVVRHPHASCTVVDVSPGRRWVDNGIPSDAEPQLRALVRSIQTAQGTGPTEVAKCVELALGADSAAPRDLAGSLSIRHICENTFEVRNASSESLELRYRVRGTTEVGPFNLRPTSTEMLVTDEVGAVDLLAGDMVVASAQVTGPSRCSR